MKRRTLTGKERELLRAAAMFVLAGEWPFEDDPGGGRKSDAQIAREREKLQSAADKMLHGSAR